MSEPSDLEALILVALIEHTSDHAWAEEIAAYLAAVIKHTGYVKQVDR